MNTRDTTRARPRPGVAFAGMGDEAFYSTTAQVIPVLLLALMFERRYFEIRDAPAWADLFLLSILIALTGGELAALAAAKDPQQAQSSPTS